MTQQPDRLVVAPGTVELDRMELLEPWAAALGDAGADALLLGRIELAGCSIDPFEVAAWLPELSGLVVGVEQQVDGDRSPTAAGRELITLSLLRGRSLLGLRGAGAEQAAAIVARMASPGRVEAADEAEVAVQGAPFAFENRPKPVDPGSAAVLLLGAEDLELDAELLASADLPAVARAGTVVLVGAGRRLRLRPLGG